MKNREWTFVDRTDWPSGPWDSEPDKRQWTDETTGLPCLIVRQGHSGHLCGYVGVSPGHPLYGVSDTEASLLPNGQWIDVHGGLTFADRCSGDEHGICHVVEADEPDDVWWFGFDCAHCGDLSYFTRKDSSTWRFRIDGEQYRTFDYVAGNCRHLAKQLADPAVHNQGASQ